MNIVKEKTICFLIFVVVLASECILPISCPPKSDKTSKEENGIEIFDEMYLKCNKKLKKPGTASPDTFSEDYKILYNNYIEKLDKDIKKEWTVEINHFRYCALNSCDKTDVTSLLTFLYVQFLALYHGYSTAVVRQYRIKKYKEEPIAEARDGIKEKNIELLQMYLLLHGYYGPFDNIFEWLKAIGVPGMTIDEITQTRKTFFKFMTADFGIKHSLKLLAHVYLPWGLVDLPTYDPNNYKHLVKALNEFFKKVLPNDFKLPPEPNTDVEKDVPVFKCVLDLDPYGKPVGKKTNRITKVLKAIELCQFITSGVPSSGPSAASSSGSTALDIV